MVADVPELAWVMIAVLLAASVVVLEMAYRTHVRTCAIRASLDSAAPPLEPAPDQ